MADLTLIEAVNLAMASEMRRDPSVVVLGEDIGRNGGVFRATLGLLDEFGPDRVIDTPLAEAGMTIAIEPMINTGKAAISELPDGWSIVTKDRSLSAQFEHTLTVTETGVEVLTLSAGTPACPAHIKIQA